MTGGNSLRNKRKQQWPGSRSQHRRQYPLRRIKKCKYIIKNNQRVTPYLLHHYVFCSTTGGREQRLCQLHKTNCSKQIKKKKKLATYYVTVGNYGKCLTHQLMKEERENFAFLTVEGYTLHTTTATGKINRIHNTQPTTP